MLAIWLARLKRRQVVASFSRPASGENFRRRSNITKRQIFFGQSLDRPVRVVRIGLVETKLRQHPSHLNIADCPLRLYDQRLERGLCSTKEHFVVARDSRPRNQVAASMLLVSRETESARRWQEFLAMHNGACYCRTGEIGKMGRPPRFPAALL